MGTPLQAPAILFVYGTLMAGEAAHALLAGCRPLGDAHTAATCTLYDCGPFPALALHGETAVAGELYALDAARLAEIDAYEGHPTYFVRVPLALADGRRAQTYVLGEAHLAGARIIASGSWRMYRRRR